MKTVQEFKEKKDCHEKITMITCYDYTSATIVEKTQIDCVLVGDSAAMVMHGEDNTTYATVEQIVWCTQAVSRGIKSKFIIGDMPFMSYRTSLSETMNAVASFIRAGAHAIKLEGAHGNLEMIKHIVESGVPVMGHIGMTPQHIHAMGGFKVQGKTQEAYDSLIKQAKQLEENGCFSIVLECVPSQLAKEITDSLSIPTIGIGAGSGTDGQVLVFQDLLGLQTEFKPKFVKTYLNGAELFTKSIDQFVEEVQDQTFPSEDHTYGK
jgi:3-methyl-2-oxobutanoate hydroxymethyltransferase